MRVHTHTHTYTHTHTHTYMHAHTRVRTHTHTHTEYTVHNLHIEIAHGRSIWTWAWSQQHSSPPGSAPRTFSEVDGPGGFGQPLKVDRVAVDPHVLDAAHEGGGDGERGLLQGRLCSTQRAVGGLNRPHHGVCVSTVLFSQYSELFIVILLLIIIIIITRIEYKIAFNCIYARIYI